MKVRYIPEGAVAREFPEFNAVVYLAGDGVARPLVAYGYSGKRNVPDFKFRFRDEAQRERQIVKFVEGLKAVAEAKARYKAEVVKRAAENVLNVGDILYTSWGYDQTNVDFFKVIKVSPTGKTVDLAEIGKNYKETGFMCGNSTPNPDKLYGIVPNKRVGAYGVKIDSVATARKYEGKPVYESHYA